MYAEKLIVKRELSGKYKTVSQLLLNKPKGEDSLVTQAPLSTVTYRRVPHPDIAGKVIIKGDIMSSVSALDWNVLE